MGGEQRYKDRLSGSEHSGSNGMQPVSRPSMTAEASGEFPRGSRCEIGDRPGRTSVTRGPNMGEISAVVSGGCAGALEALGCGRTRWAFSGDKLCHRHLFTWLISASPTINYSFLYFLKLFVLVKEIRKSSNTK